MDEVAQLRARVAELELKLAEHEAREELEQRNLARFNQLDFESVGRPEGCNWPLFEDIHHPTVHTVMPDGRTIDSAKIHTDECAHMFTYMPDMHVAEHPVELAQGDWTAVVGVFGGTFSQPMVRADGTRVEPTGKTVRLAMATFARWDNGQMVDEILFWDNAEFARQMGIAP